MDDGRNDVMSKTQGSRRSFKVPLKLDVFSSPLQLELDFLILPVAVVDLGIPDKRSVDSPLIRRIPQCTLTHASQVSPLEGSLSEASC